MRPPSHRSVPIRLTPVQVTELIQAMDSFPARIRERGKRYAASAHVGPLLSLEDRVGARVRGTRVYEVWWLWDEDLWEASCDCPMGYECKHAYAVACGILAALAVPPDRTDRRLALLLPDDVSGPAPLGHPDAEGSSSRRASPRETDEDDVLEADPDEEIEGSELFADSDAGTGALDRRTSGPPGAAPRGRPFTFWAPGTLARRDTAARRSGTLAQLRAATHEWDRTAVLQRMLAQNPRVFVPAYASPFSEILADADFDLMCWRLAQTVPRWTEGWLPDALAPYRERDDLRQRHLARMRQALADRLSRWSPVRPPAARRSLRFVLGIVVGQGGVPTLTLEGRLTSSRLQDRPRTLPQLQHLLGEAERDPGTLPAEQTVLLDAYLSRRSGWAPGDVSTDRGVSTSVLRRLAELGAGTPALAWAEDLDPELAARWGLPAGESVRPGAPGAAILPACVAAEGGVTLDLQMSWPDGRRCGLREGLLLAGTRDGTRRHPTLFVRDGAIHTVAEAPPQEIVDAFLGAGGLPLERGAHTRLLERMARRFPSVRESLAPYVRARAATPVAAIDLREDDWMQIRLFAVPAGEQWQPGDRLSGAGHVYEFGPEESWEPFVVTASGRLSPAAPDPPASVPAADAEAPGSAWFDLLDETDLAPAVEWLSTTGAVAGTKGTPGGLTCPAPDRHVGWWLHLGHRRMATFAGAWDSRPAGVQWYCTPAARRLLVESAPVRPRLRVEASGTDWFNVSAEWEAEGLELTDEDLAALRRATTPYVKISSGWVRRQAGNLVERAAETLADLGIEPGAGEQRLSVWQLAQARPESLAALVELGADPAAAAGIARLRDRIAAFKGLPPARVPRGFQGTLRPYQQAGVDFLAYTSSLGLGAILADDMGLGKTVQALAWLLWLRRRTPALGPALVVCPASVVHNWAREAERFAPGLRVAIAASGKERSALLREASRHDLLVTNYALLRRDIAAWQRVPLGVAILDEAQNIKNPDAAVSRASLTLQAHHRLALTGTPLENRALDLWSILAFVNPGLLGNRSAFVARYDRADAPAHARRLLAARLRPVLLRRMKQEVAQDLPPRIEERRDCEMHPGQRRLYLAELVRSRRLIADLADTAAELGRNRIHILAALTRLRQICCHPELVIPGRGLGSAKFDALWEILDPLLAEGHKVLVFSQFVRCLSLLKAEMTDRGLPHHLLTGQTRNREEVVSRFQADGRPGVFLISLRAGGTGLNLTAAGYVVLFDPWWNPAVEAQAIDRTHRIGQERTVIAYRLLTRGTIEEKIWDLQQRKASLAREVLGEDGFAKSMTRADLEYLLAPD